MDETLVKMIAELMTKPQRLTQAADQPTSPISLFTVIYAGILLNSVLLDVTTFLLILVIVVFLCHNFIILCIF